MPVRIVRGNHATFTQQERQQRIADAAVVERAPEAGQALGHGDAAGRQNPTQGGETLAQGRVAEVEQIGDLAPGLPGQGQRGDRAERRRQVREHVAALGEVAALRRAAPR